MNATSGSTQVHEDGQTVIDTFFYGLFMDTVLLRSKGISAAEPRKARLDDYRLSIGKRATLIEASGHRVYGMLIRLTPPDLQRLYSEESVRAYQPKDVTVALEDDSRCTAVVYVLPAHLHSASANPEYAAKLHELASRLDLPHDYVQEILRS